MLGVWFPLKSPMLRMSALTVHQNAFIYSYLNLEWEYWLLSYLHYIVVFLMFSYPFPPVTQCLSVACQRASVRLSTSVDPFTRPCDYFLITCGSDRPWTTTRGKQRDKGPPLNLQKQKGAEMRTEKNLDGNMRGEETLDRKTALMRYLQEALGTIV